MKSKECGSLGIFIYSLYEPHEDETKLQEHHHLDDHHVSLYNIVHSPRCHENILRFIICRTGTT